MKSNKSKGAKSKQSTLDFWKMVNLSTCEYDSVRANSAWSEFDIITGDCTNRDSSNDSGDNSSNN